MKLIVAGSRTFQNYRLLSSWLNQIRDRELFVEIVSGGAKGADLLGEQYAKERGLALSQFPADWKQHGKMAGPIRNEAMGKYADELLAFWDLQSTGTKHMIEYMLSLNKPVIVIPFRKLSLKEKLSQIS